MTRRILVTGSRTWTDFEAVERVLDDELLKYGFDMVIVHGNATGADSIAAAWAFRRDIAAEPHPAEWRKFGVAAGRIRNTAMIDLGADVCHAFPNSDSRGTFHCMRAARRAGIPVVNHATARTR